MKVLRLYDHNGVLQLERNVYVDGEDFKYEASYPQAVWLGTITLTEVTKELDQKSFEALQYGITKEHEKAIRQAAIDEGIVEPTELEPTIEEKEAKVESKKRSNKSKRDKRTTTPGSA